jgi:hypothetical protein
MNLLVTAERNVTNWKGELHTDATVGCVPDSCLGKSIRVGPSGYRAMLLCWKTRQPLAGHLPESERSRADSY